MPEAQDSAVKAKLKEHDLARSLRHTGFTGFDLCFPCLDQPIKKLSTTKKLQRSSNCATLENYLRNLKSVEELVRLFKFFSCPTDM